MVRFSMIFATSKNSIIGNNQSIPWHLPADFKWFKEKTMGKPVIMGRKTFDSIGKPLPGRPNIVITRDRNWSHDDVIVCHHIISAMKIVEREYKDCDEAFFIGGSTIYKKALPHCNKVYRTIVDGCFEGDTKSLALPIEEWEIIYNHYFYPDIKNKYGCTFQILERVVKESMRSRFFKLAERFARPKTSVA